MQKLLPHGQAMKVGRAFLRHRGFTLIELMIVVAAIAILTTIALPSYQSYVIKSRRTDAKNGLLDLASREERYFSVNNTYTTDLSLLGYGVAANTTSVAINASGQSYYTLNATAATATTYTATAVPTGAQAADTTCATYQIDQLGTQTNWSGTTQITGTGCW